MDISLIQGTISGLKAAGDIAKSFLELRSLSEVQGKVIQLQSVILSAQSSALTAQAHESAMIEQIRNLKEEIARVKAWEEEKQRYKMVNPWPGFGIIFYALKESRSNSEPPHWVCTKCYEDGRKSVLNPRWVKNLYMFVCPACKHDFILPHGIVPRPEYALE